MGMRRIGWRLIAPATVCVVAGAMSAAAAKDWSRAMPPAEIPMTTGGVAPTLMWGGPVPMAPRPGEVPLYRPSPSIVDRPAQPEAAYAPADDPYRPPVSPQAQPYPDALPTDAAPEPDDATAPEPIEQAAPARLQDGSERSSRRLYTPVDAGDPGEAAPGDPSPDRAELPPLADPVDIGPEIGSSRQDDSSDGAGEDGAAAPDPWDGLKDVTPGIAPPPVSQRVHRQRRNDFAALEPASLARRRSPSEGDILLDRGRGRLESETPSGYQAMPTSEAMCRRALQRLGVRFVDATSIRSSRSCGIDYPVKVADISPGIEMRPPATLNCMAALRVAQWMKDEVTPAARWKLLGKPTALINASSYRCSRIAGSGSISEHASGSALDVHGFAFADGSTVEIEKKGFFQFSEKSFQKKVRTSACRYFGTVLGPGYNEDHADHLHLDTRQRRRSVCK